MSTFKTAAVVALAVAAFAGCNQQPADTDTDTAPTVDEPPATSSAARPRPNPDAFEPGVIADHYAPGEYYAECGTDGELLNYWPDTDDGYRSAADACAETADYGERIGEELERRGYPGWGDPR